jgi:rod shape-determining protein MreC
VVVEPEVIFYIEREEFYSFPFRYRQEFMTEKLKKAAMITLLVSAVIAPFVLFSSPLKSWQSSHWLVTLLQETIYPVERGWHLGTSQVVRLWQNYVYLSEAARENEALKQKLNFLEARVLAYDEQILENDRLRKLLGFSGRSEKRLLAAEVVGHNQFATFETLRISRGSLDGVKLGMPVVAADGVVGKVIRVGQAFSDVQLVVDSDFHMDVLLQRTRVRGVLSGASKGQCILQLHKRVEIRIGDTLITSGIVGGFPKGLPIGRVIRITYETENVAQSVTVEPWVDHRRLEEVMVILSTDPELETIAEVGGTPWMERALTKQSED